MAARLNHRHQEMVREKIRASQLVNRLENHVFSFPEMGDALNKFLDKHKDNENEEFIEELRAVLGELSHRMDNTQVTAALGLLKKCVPDLRASDDTLTVDGEVGIRSVVKEYVGSRTDD